VPLPLTETVSGGCSRKIARQVFSVRIRSRTIERCETARHPAATADLNIEGNGLIRYAKGGGYKLILCHVDGAGVALPLTRPIPLNKDSRMRMLSCESNLGPRIIGLTAIIRT
jgi:hypothetical protein